MMHTRFIPERTPRKSADIILICLIILLAGMGLGILFSASYHRASAVFSNPYYFIYRQCLWAACGAAGACVLSRVPLSFLNTMTPAFVVLSFVLMLLCFVPGLAPQIMGARRWIVLFGYSLQPSEFAKLALVLYLARMLYRKQERLGDFVNTFLPLVCVVGGLSVLTFAQNDFSTAVFLLFLGLCLFFIANVKLLYVGGLALAAAAGGVGLLMTKSHRLQRIMSFLHPGQDPSGADYQILAAKAALQKGGLWGTGIGQGTRKLGGLPEAHSDFIFAVLAEEVGFLGVAAVLALFILFAYKGYTIARGCGENRYGFYLAFGITTCIFAQALMNMAVVADLVPATGITLPFFSSGGSSLFVTFLLCGILVNLSRTGGTMEGAEKWRT
ncbi:MAG: putative lipid II flippase FtsW [Spirochaetales bacterium]|jgi:cell division protein FtsW|nr:putative lipid II flippase FtsW [Spirochaetales bacterium]